MHMPLICLKKGDGFWEPISLFILCQTKQISIKSFYCLRGNSVHFSGYEVLFIFHSEFPIIYLGFICLLKPSLSILDKHIQIWNTQHLWTEDILKMLLWLTFTSCNIRKMQLSLGKKRLNNIDTGILNFHCYRNIPSNQKQKTSPVVCGWKGL